MTNLPPKSSDVAARLDREKQAAMRPMVKASLLVTTGLVPTGIAAQTLVG